MKNACILHNKPRGYRTLFLISYLFSYSIFAQGIPDVQWTKPGVRGIVTSGGLISVFPGTSNNTIATYTPQGNFLLSADITLSGDPSGGFYTWGALNNDQLAIVHQGYVPKFFYHYRTLNKLPLYAQGAGLSIFESSSFSGFPTGIQDIIGAPNGDAVILETYFPTSTTSTTNALFWRQGSSGSSKLISYPNPTPDSPDRTVTKGERIINTPDGGFLLVGYYNTAGIIGDPLNATAPSSGWVAKLDDQGNVQWQKLLGDFPIPTSLSGSDPGAVHATYAITDATLAADGNGFILVGSGYGFSSMVPAPTRTVMLELDLNGNLKRSKVFPVDPTPAYVTSYKGSDGKRYYALGNTDLSVPGFDYRVLKISSEPGLATDPASLSLITQRTFSFQYDGNPQERLSDINVAADGGLVLMGAAGVIKLLPEFVSPIGLLQPLYSCSTKQFWFRSSGGDGSPVSYMAIGITPWTTTAGPYTVPEYPDADAFTLIARQASNLQAPVTLVWDWRVVCGPPVSTTPTPGTTTPASTSCGSPSATIGQPLTLLPPAYNCATGEITFQVTGGNGTPIEFLSVGITGWSTNCQSKIDSPDLIAEIRNPNSTVEPFTLYARQRNPDGSLTMVQLKWDARATCNGAGFAATSDPSAELRVLVLGNPTRNETVEVAVWGAEGQAVRFVVTNMQGQAISEQTLSRASASDRVRLSVGQSSGMFLLRVSTPTAYKTVKLLRQ